MILEIFSNAREFLNNSNPSLFQIFPGAYARKQ